MKIPYDLGRHPACPVLQITLINEVEGLRVGIESALIDTGADGTLVPIAHLGAILAPAASEVRLRSHWGEQRTAELFVIDLSLGSIVLPGIMVVGDELGDEVVLGRDVLNKLRLILNGPARETELR